jgi:hypothetical protein
MNLLLISLFFFNHERGYCSCFHPNGNHILLGGEVYDARNLSRFLFRIPHLTFGEYRFTSQGDALISSSWRGFNDLIV